jgi:phospholipid/cholesterol/gamma-HCH transport system ATP-binding protein
VAGPVNAAGALPSAHGSGILQAEGLGMAFGPHVVLENISLAVRRGEVLAIVGGSGSGKSTLLRLLALLLAPTRGNIEVFGRPIVALSDPATNSIRRRIGVMFQQGALFGDQTVLENVSVPLLEHTRLSRRFVRRVAMLKIRLAGLEPEAGALYPSQLSGGMRKRASVARAIALDPEILFLDEPSSGLDPISADAMDELVLHMNRTLGLTVVLVTHDMNSLWRVADRVVLLADAKIAAMGSMQEVTGSRSEAARDFFGSSRGRAAEIGNG